MQAAANQTSITIYKVTNLVNGKPYIGQTKAKIEQRLKQHFRDAFVLKKKNPFHSAIRMHGADNFRIEPVLVCDVGMANLYEKKCIEIFNSYAKTKTGYNVADPLDHYRSISGLIFGEKHGCAKLTENDVLSIRQITDLSNKDCVDLFGVALATVKRIRAGTSWKKTGGLLPIASYKKDRRKGENHHKCVVPDDIREIIKQDKVTERLVLAKKYGISPDVVGAIRGPQPQIPKPRQISEEIGQYIIDHPHISNSVLSKQTGVSLAQISRIKSGKQFRHLKSSASKDQWDAYFDRRHKATGGKIG